MVSKADKKIETEFKPLQTTPNKCVRFFLQLDKLKHIFNEVFKCLNWLPLNYRFKKSVNSIVFMYFIEQFPSYLNEVFDIATESNFQLTSSFQKLKCLIRKTKNDKYDLSYIDPTFWNQNPHTVKRSNNLNTFKHNFKKYF